MNDLRLFGDHDEHDHGCKRLIRIPPSWTIEAEFGGPGNCFRYKLMHRWSDGPMALFGMTNPSGADLRFGDMTVMKTSRIARRLGFGGQWIANSCAYRDVRPKGLLTVSDPVGPRNHAAIAEMAADAGLIVVAHGRLPGQLQRHADAMVTVLRSTGKPLHVLGLTEGDRVPMHPLARGKNHIPEDVEPFMWE